MLHTAQRYFRTALRFPKRDLATLRWIRTGSNVTGVLALLLAWTGFGNAVSTLLWIPLALGWFAQASFAAGGVRRVTTRPERSQPTVSAPPKATGPRCPRRLPVSDNHPSFSCLRLDLRRDHSPSLSSSQGR